MSSGAAHPPPPDVGSADYDDAATRLLGVIEASCDPRAGFARQLEVSLSVTLRLFDEDPELGRLLTISDLGRRDLLEANQLWLARFGSLLGDAARRLPEALEHPPFVESHLLAAVCWQCRRLFDPVAPVDSEQMLDQLLEFLLPYYLSPPRPRLPRLADRLILSENGDLGE